MHFLSNYIMCASNYICFIQYNYQVKESALVSSSRHENVKFTSDFVENHAICSATLKQNVYFFFATLKRKVVCTSGLMTSLYHMSVKCILQ